MGVNLKVLFDREEIKIDDLKNKIIVVDGYNMLYQFLTTIRAPDGAVFTNKEGVPTSHMIGLFSRVTNLMLKGIKLVFVFDGVPPKIKQRESERRSKLKKEAALALKKAEKEEDIDGMKKYAGRTAVLSKDMVSQAKKLLDYLGIPWVQAPSEGEAQASYMVKKGDGWAVASQDFDSLLYAAPRLIQNLSITGKRKLPRKFAYVTVNPELIELKSNLKKLGIDLDQLKTVAILIGTDYNPKGVMGIGPKKALLLVKKHKNVKDILKEVGFDESEFKNIKQTFDKMPVTDDYKLDWAAVNKKKIKKLLIDALDFNETRVNNTLDKFDVRQKSLGAFLK